MATREDRRPWEVVLREWQLKSIYERIYSHNPSLRRCERTRLYVERVWLK